MKECEQLFGGEGGRRGREREGFGSVSRGNARIVVEEERRLTDRSDIGIDQTRHLDLLSSSELDKFRLRAKNRVKETGFKRLLAESFPGCNRDVFGIIYRTKIRSRSAKDGQFTKNEMEEAGNSP